jgi:hypothetical protein
MARFESILRCPDCHAGLRREADDALRCMHCSYEARNEGMVYNLLRSGDRNELYPGDRDDVIDFSLPAHERRLLEGWYELEGTYGNKYRWIGSHACAVLKRTQAGPLQLRIRGFAPESIFTDGGPVIHASVNGIRVGSWSLDRRGLFVLEAPLGDAPDYRVELDASPVWQAPGDQRLLTVNISMLRLVPRE